MKHTYTVPRKKYKHGPHQKFVVGVNHLSREIFCDRITTTSSYIPIIGDALVSRYAAYKGATDRVGELAAYFGYKIENNVKYLRKPKESIE
tara:strand:+ start:1223 stop:1495 length:273 start_codon:yes stop_codon:yes gene_type:complete